MSAFWTYFLPLFATLCGFRLHTRAAD